MHFIDWEISKLVGVAKHAPERLDEMAAATSAKLKREFDQRLKFAEPLLTKG